MGNRETDDRLIWIDLEMTGLDPERERVIEIAVLVTDAQLEIVAEGPDLVVHQHETLLSGMDAWNREHHGASGLTEQVRASTIDEAAAEAEVLAFLHKHCEPGRCPLAGNSVHQDHRFIARYLPGLAAFVHYRQVDVSTIKELVRRWLPGVYAARPEKKGAHRALDDIRESIEELRYYRRHAFLQPSGLTH